MTRIELELHDDVISSLNKLKNINDDGIEILIPEGSVLFDNVLNLKLLKNQMEKLEKTVHFQTEDPIGQTLINSMDENAVPMSLIDLEDEELDNISEYNIRSESSATPRIDVAGAFSAAKKRLRVLKNTSLVGIPLVILLLLLGGYYLAGKSLTSATVTIDAKEEEITRSVTVRLTSASSTNVAQKTLKSTTVSTTLEDTQVADTTGEKQIGEKGEGTATIYNKTDEDITLKKGAILTYDEKDLKYVLKSAVTIPKRVEEDNPDDPGTQVFKLGEEEVEIEAQDIGEQYNIKKDTSLEVNGYKSSEMTAKISSAVTGGESETIKAVAEVDRTNLSKALTENMKKNAEKEIKTKSGQNTKLIPQSITVTITNEQFSHKVGDETDKLTLIASANVEALAYSEKDLEAFVEELMQGIIPEGYMAAEGQRETKVDVLGQSSSSVLTAKEADIQITIKVKIVTAVDEAKIMEDIRGKSYKEVEEYLRGLKDTNGISLEIKPGLPLFNSIPQDTSKIDVVIN